MPTNEFSDLSLDELRELVREKAAAKDAAVRGFKAELSRINAAIDQKYLAAKTSDWSVDQLEAALVARKAEANPPEVTS